MENNKKEDLVFVSFDKIWSNFKRFWWISVVLMIVMLVYGGFTYSRNLKINSASEQENMVPVVVAENPDERHLVGKIVVEYKIDVDAYLKSMSMAEKNVDTITLYSELSNKIVEYASNIVEANGIYDAIENTYSEKGYFGIQSSPAYVGDETYDTLSVNAINDYSFLLEYSGKGGIDRMQVGTDVAVQYLIEQLSQICDYASFSVTGTPQVKLRIKIYGFPTDFEPTEESYNSIVESYKEYNEIATGDIPYVFTVEGMFKVSTLIKGAVGFIFGLLIIFVISITDKVIRNKEELEKVFGRDEDFLGEMNHKKADSVEVEAISVIEMCKKKGITNLTVTTIESGHKSYDITDFVNKLSEGEIKATQAAGIESCAGTVRKVSEAEGVILVINSGCDNIVSVSSAMKRISTVKANFLGYVFNK